MQISFHQLRGPPSSRLSIVMVVQLGLSCLRDDVSFWRRVSLRGSHSSRLSQQSRQSRLRWQSRPRRQSRHLSYSYAALVVLVPR